MTKLSFAIHLAVMDSCCHAIRTLNLPNKINMRKCNHRTRTVTSLAILAIGCAAARWALAGETLKWHQIPKAVQNKIGRAHV